MTRGKKIASVILTLVFLAGMLLGAAYITRDKSGDSKVKAFYDNPEDFDVYIFGSSHATMGILPLEMWKAEGITSYNFSNYGQALPIDYWLLRNTVAVHKPKVVVIDVFTVFFDEKYSHSHMGFLHQSLDPIPVSKLKYEALDDLLDDGENHLEMYLPFSLYHSRWENLSTDDLKPVKANPNLGADINQLTAASINGISVDASNRLFTYVGPFELPDITDTIETLTPAKEYLVKMIEYCKSEDIEVVLVNCPGHLFDDQVKYINSVYALADKYDVPLIDGMRMDVVNYETDMFDSAHLNSSGARKWSNYLASYLIDNYELIDHRGDNGYSYIDEYYNDTVNTEMDLLDEDSSLYGCLMLAANPDYEVSICINANSAVAEDDQVIRFIANIFATHNCENKWIDAMNSWDKSQLLEIATGEFGKDFHLNDVDISIMIYNSTLERTILCHFNANEEGLDGYQRVK